VLEHRVAAIAVLCILSNHDGWFRILEIKLNAQFFSEGTDSIELITNGVMAHIADILQQGFHFTLHQAGDKGIIATNLPLEPVILITSIGSLSTVNILLYQFLSLYLLLERIFSPIPEISPVVTLLDLTERFGVGFEPKHFRN
jgi:hypothetical protein